MSTRIVQMFDPNSKEAALLFAQINEDVRASKHRLIVERRAVERLNRLRR